MNLNLTTVALTLAVLGLVAEFDIIQGAGAWPSMTLFALGAMLFMGQGVHPSVSRLWWR